jgi:hypothetical protein
VRSSCLLPSGPLRVRRGLLRGPTALRDLADDVVGGVLAAWLPVVTACLLRAWAGQGRGRRCAHGSTSIFRHRQNPVRRSTRSGKPPTLLTNPQRCWRISGWSSVAVVGLLGFSRASRARVSRWSSAVRCARIGHAVGHAGLKARRRRPRGNHPRLQPGELMDVVHTPGVRCVNV